MCIVDIGGRTFISVKTCEPSYKVHSIATSIKARSQIPIWYIIYTSSWQYNMFVEMMIVLYICILCINIMLSVWRQRHHTQIAGASSYY